jgi:hypothetical protein
VGAGGIEEGCWVLSDEKRLFRVELRTWVFGKISLLVFGFNEEDAEREGWRFIGLHRWSAKVGKVEDLGLSYVL